LDSATSDEKKKQQIFAYLHTDLLLFVALSSEEKQVKMKIYERVLAADVVAVPVTWPGLDRDELFASSVPSIFFDGRSLKGHRLKAHIRIPRSVSILVDYNFLCFKYDR
jgi:hypothetical protein